MKHLLAPVFAALGLLLASAPLQAAEPVDLVVSGGTVVTMDGVRQVIRDGFIAIRDGRIVAVGKRRELEGRYEARERISARGKLVIPGLVNTHTHVPMTLFRGIADDQDLMTWLLHHVFPAERDNVDEGFVTLGTELGALEMIEAGITTFVDMYYFERQVAEATRRAGLRAILGETIIDLPTGAPDNKTTADALAYTEAFIREWQGDRLITPAIAPHSPYLVNPDDFRRVRALADRTGAPIVTHLSESTAELATVAERHDGLSPVQHLEQLGVLGPDLIAAHMIYPRGQDIRTLRRRGVGTAHNPVSNAKIAAGLQPTQRLLKGGVAVGLGSDGAASNNTLSLFDEMKTTALLQKLWHKDPTAMPARTAFEMATIGGARAIHLDRDIGSLEVGKRADLAVLSLNSAHLTPYYDVYSLLVYSALASDVVHTVVEGRVLMRDRRVLTLDKRRILAGARAMQRQVCRRLLHAHAATP